MAIKKRKRVIKRRAWTKDDLKEFKALAKKKTSAKVIAKRFKRTVAAIRQRASQMGLSLDTRN